MSIESYRYKVSLNYVNSKNSEIQIDSNQIQYIGIDRNFDACNMPVIAVVASIEKDILDDMIINVNNNIVTLGIYKYDASNQNDNIVSKCINDRFIYMLPDDISKSNVIDYKNDLGNTIKDNETNRRLYKDVTLWLLPQDIVNNNRNIINGVFKQATMNSLIIYTTEFIGNLLLEPINYDNKFDQIIIPPTDTISDYLAYLNDNVSVFYDNGYRFFMDFDMSYIMSLSGLPIKSKTHNIYTIAINIKDIIPTVDEAESGVVIDKRNSKCTITVNTANVDFTKNNVTNKMVNSITTIDSKGERNTVDIDINKSKITKNMNKIVVLSNTDQNAANNIANSYSINNKFITLTKNDLDASMFTMNKEYIVTCDDNHASEYNGRYLLSYVKQFYVKQTDMFIMTTILRLKKIEK